MVQGRIENKATVSQIHGMKVYNFLDSRSLQKELNQSELVICRSGYSSIMDLAQLGKKAFFIPTPNQPEQEYLASYLEKKGIAPYATEENFSEESLQKIGNYSGFQSENSSLSAELLRFF